jgi:YD repeat-containing protein
MIRVPLRIVSVLLAILICVALPFALHAQSGVTYAYDDLGRLTAVIDPSGNAAGYSYDAVGNLLAITRYTSSQVSALNFSPASGPVGTTVTITGTGFSATSSSDSVSFHGTSATITSATVNQLVVTVPTGATTGTIAVTSPAGTFTTTASFTVTTGGAPTITSFTPTIATAGTSISISGTNFSTSATNDRVSFNQTAQFFLPTVTSTSISTTVPVAAASGHISVATPAGQATSSQDLYVPFGTHAVGDVGYTNRTTLGGSATVSLSAANKIALLIFDAVGGQGLSLSMSGSTFSSCNLYLIAPNGTQLRGFGCTTSVPFFDNLVLPQTGTYTLGLDPSGSTGSISMTLNNSSTITGAITPGGTSITVATGVGQDAKYAFTGIASQRVSLLVTNWTNNSNVSLVNPNESVLASASGFPTGFTDVQTLPTTGTYTAWVQHFYTSTGSVTLQLYSVPADVTGTITAGGAGVSVATTAPGQNASLTFSGTSGQQVSMSLSSGSYSSCTLTLKGPTGTSVRVGSCGSTTSFVDTATLPTTGTHTIFIDPQGPATGGTTVQLNNAPDVTGTITAGGSSVTATTTVPGQDARITFSGTAGQNVSLVVTNWTNPGGVNLVGPDGTTLASANITGTQTGFIDVQTLPTTGTYTLWVQHDFTFTGSTTLQLYSVPSDATAAATLNGSSVTVTTTVPGQNASVTFSGTSGQSINVNLTSGSFTNPPGCTMTLKDPSGTSIGSGGCSSSGYTPIGPVTLGSTGTYTLHINPSGAATGSVGIQVSTN